jgi:hypothetical protein
VIIEEKKEYLTKISVEVVAKNSRNDKVITCINRRVSVKQNGEWIVDIISRNTIAIVFLEFLSKYKDLIN